MLRKITLLIVGLSMLFTTSCTTTDQQISEEQGLRVGVTPNMPPLIYEYEEKVQGLEADFAELLAKEIGEKLIFVELEWTDQIEALQEGKIDIIMSGMTITFPRKNLVSFSAPYMRNGVGALVRKEDYNRLQVRNVLLSLDGNIGVEAGTTGAELVEKIMPTAEAISAENIYELRQMLVDKEVDAIVHDIPTLWFAAAAGDELIVAPYTLMPQYMAWAVNKSDAELLDKVNAAIAKWNQDGTTAKVLTKWLKSHKRFIVK